jgi:hypothetical protein
MCRSIDGQSFGLYALETGTHLPPPHNFPRSRKYLTPDTHRSPQLATVSLTSL